MKVVWELGAATVKDVCEAISLTKPTAYTTILTLMGILEAKGALVHERAGRAFVYTPLLSRQQATQNQVMDMLTRFFDGAPEKMVEYVVKNEFKNSEQFNDVRNMLWQWEATIVAPPEDKSWEPRPAFMNRSDD